LEQEISAAANGLDKPLDDEFKESRLPEKVAPAYRAMYAYGMHLRIKSAKEEKITSDIGVAFAVWWRKTKEANWRVWSTLVGLKKSWSWITETTTT
jgi:hypothetical protein